MTSQVSNPRLSNDTPMALTAQETLSRFKRAGKPCPRSDLSCSSYLKDQQLTPEIVPLKRQSSLGSRTGQALLPVNTHVTTQVAPLKTSCCPCTPKQTSSIQLALNWFTLIWTTLSVMSTAEHDLYVRLALCAIFVFRQYYTDNWLWDTSLKLDSIEAAPRHTGLIFHQR